MSYFSSINEYSIYQIVSYLKLNEYLRFRSAYPEISDYKWAMTLLYQKIREDCDVLTFASTL